MDVEKKAPKKVGFYIILALVIITLIGGGYYLITHKDSLNIDWKINLPWKKEGREEQDVVNDLKGNATSTPTTTTGFVNPTGIADTQIKGMAYCYGSFEKLETKDDYFILTIRFKGEYKSNPNYCKVSITETWVDGYKVSAKTDETEVEPGKEEYVELKILKSELEENDLHGMSKIRIRGSVSGRDGKEPVIFTETGIVRSDRNFNNEKNGILIDDLNGSKIKYYKTVTDAVNTYIYFTVENTNLECDSVIKIRKLVINDKIYSQKDFSKEINTDSKGVIYLEIPKSEFNRVKKFTVAFINESTSIKDKVTSYYLSNEYTREM